MVRFAAHGAGAAESDEKIVFSAIVFVSLVLWLLGISVYSLDLVSKETVCKTVGEYLAARFRY